VALAPPANTVANRNLMRALITQAKVAYELECPGRDLLAAVPDRNAGGKHPLQVGAADYDLFTSYFVLLGARRGLQRGRSRAVSPAGTRAWPFHDLTRLDCEGLPRHEEHSCDRCGVLSASSSSCRGNLGHCKKRPAKFTRLSPARTMPTRINVTRVDRMRKT